MESEDSHSITMALLRFYYPNYHPERLSEENKARLMLELDYNLKLQDARQKNVLAEVLSAMLGKAKK